MGRKRNKRHNEASNTDIITEVSVKSSNPLTLSSEYNGIFKSSEKNILELGCARGEYSLGMVDLFPEKNFIGVDIKGERLIIGSRKVKELNLQNIRFYRIQVEHIDTFFPENLFDEIWIPFPDPHPGLKNGNKRLTSERFLNVYRHILKDDGVIHLKTDCDILYNFSLETVKEHATLLESTNDLYRSDLIEHDLLKIQTTYEKRYVLEGRTIKYLKFSLRNGL